MTRQNGAVVQRFENRTAQVALAAFSVLLGLIGLAGLASESSRGTGAFFLIVGAFFVVRALRTSAVVVDDSGVSTRSILRSRRYPFSEVRGVEVATGRTGFAGYGREYLMFHLSDGQDIAFRELNCPQPKTPDAPSVVRHAAECINERLARR